MGSPFVGRKQRLYGSDSTPPSSSGPNVLLGKKRLKEIRQALAHLFKRSSNIYPRDVLARALNRPFIPPTPRLAIDLYWQALPFRADRSPARRHGMSTRECPLWVKSGHLPLYSITSSARARSVGGTVRPSALAALRLITNSNFVGCVAVQRRQPVDSRSKTIAQEPDGRQLACLLRARCKRPSAG